MKKGNASSLKVLKANTNSQSVDFDTAPKYSIEKLLIKDAVLLPDDVEPSKKEVRQLSFIGLLSNLFNNTNNPAIHSDLFD